jgi:hypothetical protein
MVRCLQEGLHEAVMPTERSRQDTFPSKVKKKTEAHRLKNQALY